MTQNETDLETFCDRVGRDVALHLAGHGVGGVVLWRVSDAGDDGGYKMKHWLSVLAIRGQMTESHFRHPVTKAVSLSHFGRGTDGCAERKFPIAFRVRRSRFPSLPW